ncbi:MAG: hypothetical protein ACON31_04960 [Candidatus Puniceispirillaceae bacterium]
MFTGRLANILIGLISLWAIYTVLASVLGVFVIFPMTSVDSDSVPMGRLHAIRLAVIGTFAFYGVMHLLQGSKEVFPIHFLKTFLFFLSIMGGLWGVRKQMEGIDVPLTEWALVLFWFWVAVVFHLSSAPRYRRYFSRK